jgi:hypothetical protein
MGSLLQCHLLPAAPYDDRLQRNQLVSRGALCHPSLHPLIETFNLEKYDANATLTAESGCKFHRRLLLQRLLVVPLASAEGAVHAFSGTSRSEDL